MPIFRVGGASSRAHLVSTHNMPVYHFSIFKSTPLESFAAAESLPKRFKLLSLVKRYARRNTGMRCGGGEGALSGERT